MPKPSKHERAGRKQTQHSQRQQHQHTTGFGAFPYVARTRRVTVTADSERSDGDNTYITTYHHTHICTTLSHTGSFAHANGLYSSGLDYMFFMSTEVHRCPPHLIGKLVQQNAVVDARNSSTDPPPANGLCLVQRQIAPKRHAQIQRATPLQRATRDADNDVHIHNILYWEHFERRSSRSRSNTVGGDLTEQHPHHNKENNRDASIKDDWLAQATTTTHTFPLLPLQRCFLY